MKQLAVYIDKQLTKLVGTGLQDFMTELKDSVTDEAYEWLIGIQDQKVIEKEMEFIQVLKPSAPLSRLNARSSPNGECRH